MLRAKREAIARDLDRAMKTIFAIFEHLPGRDLGEVLRKVNPARVEVEILHGLALLTSAQNDAEGRLLRRLPLMIYHR